MLCTSDQGTPLYTLAFGLKVEPWYQAPHVQLIEDEVWALAEASSEPDNWLGPGYTEQ